MIKRSWEEILKGTVRPREKMNMNVFQYQHRLFDGIEEVMPEINGLTNLYRQKAPEFEADTESTLWIIDKHLTKRKINQPNVDSITIIKQIIKDLTDNLNTRRPN